MMGVVISLLRGINVGGKTIRMAELSGMYESLGLSGVRTLLQSGNVVFVTGQTDMTGLARQIEDGVQRTFGFSSRILLRTKDQLRAAIEAHPFSADQLAEPGKAAVVFLLAEPDAEAVANLRQATSGTEEIWVSGQQLYVYYSNGMGQSKLTLAVIEKKLKTVGTARNWNTANKLLALAESLAGE